MRIKIAPSVLSADFSCLGREIRRAEAAGADMLHIDVMDGLFVPNITIGPAVVKCIRRATRLPLDVHLMIERPEKLIPAFVAAGADMITVHIETITKSKIKNQKSKLKKAGVKLGISLNPGTALKKIEGVLGYADFVLVMSVHPGFSGQPFIPRAARKIRRLRAIYRGDISVDGGINAETAKIALAAGANILAAGSYLFAAADMREAIERMRDAGK
jgi:ribulose-phosphate 3-epimerase